MRRQKWTKLEVTIQKRIAYHIQKLPAEQAGRFISMDTAEQVAVLMMLEKKKESKQ